MCESGVGSETHLSGDTGGRAAADGLTGDVASKTELTELKKLDFPEPTGPRSRTRAWDTELLMGT